MTDWIGTGTPVTATPSAAPTHAKMAQIYCTAREVNIGQKYDQDESRIYEKILEASATIQARMGYFIPVTETRLYIGDGRDELMIAPAISVSAVKDDDIALTLTTDYILRNLTHKNSLWANGPYTCLERENAGWSDAVEVTGQWGKWSETQLLGETVTQLIDAADISVTNGSKLSAGMILLVENEQQLVTGYGTPTQITSKINLVDGIDTGDDEMTIDNGADVYEGETIRIGLEKMLVMQIAGNVIAVKRGWEGTKQAVHANDSEIYVYRTYTVERAVNGTTAAAHGAVAAYRYVVPRDVRELTIQIAVLIKRKEEAGFAGKVGGGPDGEIFYYNEFPRTQMAEVESHYKIW